MMHFVMYKNATVPKVDVSEGIDVNKTSASKECELCHYWFFEDVGFKLEKHVCNECHDGLFVKKHSNIKRKRNYF